MWTPFVLSPVSPELRPKPKGNSMTHLLCVGGEDHALRIPFLTALRNRGLRVSAAGTGAATPFANNGIQYHRYQFDRLPT
jgi:hypothetical protein